MSPFFGKSKTTPPRNAAERERERVERARRRAGLTGESAPPMGGGGEPDEPVRVPGAGVPNVRAGALEPAVPPAPQDSTPLEDPIERPPPATPALAITDGDAQGETRAGAPALSLPARRDALTERRGRLRARRGHAERERRRVTPGRVIGVIVILLAAGAIWFGVELFEPFTGSGQGRVVVVIPRGAGASDVGKLLAGRGVVASSFFFNLYAAIEGDRGDLHSGQYVLRRGMSYSAALDVITKPPAPPPVVRVVIPEGDSRQVIAGLARADGLTGDYLAASVRSPLLAPAHYGAPRSTPNLEGFLFPATYELNVGANVSALVGEQLIAFQQNVGRASARAARRLHLTLYQLLTVASMIEREALLPTDRAKVAAVIYNRLRLAMPLGIDATLRYALNDWSAPLTESQLQLSSPYNTRLRIGLPPTPIGNPGLASLEAAAHPAHVPYLYYVNGADGCGELVFSATAAGFDQAVAAYRAALAANHGHVPVCRH